MAADELAMWCELAAVFLTAVVGTGIIWTAVGIWRDKKTWEGDEE